MKVNSQIHAPTALPPKKDAHVSQWIRGWTGNKADQGALEMRK